MLRPSLAAALLALATPALALDLDALVVKHSTANGVPEHLVRRVIKIESRGQPHLISKGNYGLMQIRYGTAKAMGYTGTPQGLLDADTNMTYAVRYLAGAYRAANGDANRAVHLYQRGYYAEAKAKHFSPYRLASQTPAPVEPAATPPATPKVKALVAKRDKAAPIETVALAPGDRPATLQERFAVAAAVKPAAAPETPAAAPPVKSVKTVALREKIAVAAPAKPAVAQEAVAVAAPVKPAARRETVAMAAPVKPAVFQETVAAAPSVTFVKPAVPSEKLVVAPQEKPAVAPREKLAVVSPVKPVAPPETLAAAPQDRPVRHHRRARADNQPFNLLTYLKTKLTTTEKPARKLRRKHHTVAATPRDGTPMLSAATPSAQKP